jgi:isopenicillin-N N-acyltransferase-like protein
MSSRLDKITLSGTPEEIGFQHGEILAEQIHQNIGFYRPLILQNFADEAQALKITQRFKERIQALNPDYVTEIDHIAMGAQVDEPLWVYALNARTELTLTKTTNECTAVVFPQEQLIGQTWDWSHHLEEGFVVMEIQFPSGHKILQLTEAGIIGKIGMNNRGLGQTLNILWMVDKVLSGVPVHVLLRAILETSSLEGAQQVIERSDRGKASNIIVAQRGQAFDVEFAGEDIFTHDILTDYYVHTNHYLHSPQPIVLDQSDPMNSHTRYGAAVDRLKESTSYTMDALIKALSDQSHETYPILRKYKVDSIEAMGYCGTLATVVMDLKNLTMKVRNGNPSSPGFSADEFDMFGFEDN